MKDALTLIAGRSLVCCILLFLPADVVLERIIDIIVKRDSL